MVELLNEESEDIDKNKRRRVFVETDTMDGLHLSVEPVAPPCSRESNTTQTLSGYCTASARPDRAAGKETAMV